MSSLRADGVLSGLTQSETSLKRKGAPQRRPRVLQAEEGLLGRFARRALFGQVRLLVRHQLLTDTAQQREVALVLLQHVGNQLVVVHVLHVIADTPIEEDVRWR